MSEFPGCEETRNDQIVVLKDKKSANSKKNSITFLNKNRIKFLKVVIDDCVIKEGDRCDYLLIIPDQKYYFIELKGCDVAHAIKQLEATILFVQGKKRIIEKRCFISAKFCPSLTSEFQRKIMLFKKKNRTSLIIRNSAFKHNFEN